MGSILIKDVVNNYVFKCGYIQTDTKKGADLKDKINCNRIEFRLSKNKVVQDSKLDHILQFSLTNFT